MADWKNHKALGLIDPLAGLQKRSPTYYERYVGLEDEFGFKLETFARWEPIFCFLFDDYFKVETRGIENIPEDGPVILAGNHSGLLPLDGGMLTIAMCHFHKSPRRVRYLATDWFFNLPGIKEWIIETGQVRGTLENAEKLIANNEIVGVYPEGIRGVGKPFRDRYRVIDFHPGFVQLAISTGTPIIPIATVGGDEIFPNFVNVKELAQLLKFPFFPVTLGFPWLPFPLMFVPLPVRWLVNVHKPIYLGYPPEKAKDRKLCLSIAREIQHTIQKDLNDLLRRRKSVFTGWDEEPVQASEESN